jgi:hypothetical protein
MVGQGCVLVSAASSGNHRAHESRRQVEIQRLEAHPNLVLFDQWMKLVAESEQRVVLTSPIVLVAFQDRIGNRMACFCHSHSLVQMGRVKQKRTLIDLKNSTVR